jgi:hypothetical protein
MLFADAFVIGAFAVVIGIIAVLALIRFVVYRAGARSGILKTTSSPATHGPLTCPHCKTVAARDAEFRGQTVFCPHCRGVFTAPDVPPATAPLN